MTIMQDDKYEYSIGLLPGDTVEVRSKEEIFSTLDENGMLDSMPFMPEMLNYCGQTFKVYKRAEKTCDTIYKSGGRRVFNSVHLEDIRCDGSAHGGCQASCLIYWKEAWLKKVPSDNTGIPVISKMLPLGVEHQFRKRNNVCTEEKFQASAIQEQGDEDKPVAYKCQVTELVKASEPLAWWDVRQYYRDVVSGNVTIGRALRALVISIFRNLSDLGIGYRLIIKMYNRLRWLHKGVIWPYRLGKCEKTPKEVLNLQPGELVEVKSHEDILATLDKTNKNRGLYFDAEMVPYCGKQYRVAKRVSQILDEKTGVMVDFGNECIILENVICQSDYSQMRLFCPRSIFPYWREIWLKRVEN